MSRYLKAVYPIAVFWYQYAGYIHIRNYLDAFTFLEINSDQASFIMYLSSVPKRVPLKKLPSEVEKYVLDFAI